MALSQEDIDRLERAMVTGTLKVVVEGKEITYRSIPEIERALTYARSQVHGQSSMTSFAAFSRD